MAVSSYALDGEMTPAAFADDAIPGAETAEPERDGDRLLIREYRIRGASQLPRIDVETAVYPFLGPARSLDDIEAARAALEKAYHDAGYSSVGVEIPPQRPRRGVIILQVSENPVGRLRVRGSRYYDIERIKREARSMAEGRVLNFNEVTNDLIALNKWPGRRITPQLQPGIEPGTLDVDLLVEDDFPLKGSVELNNRYSVDTTELRLNLSATYQNLWQLGHSIGGTYQMSPQDTSEVSVFSGFYIARFSQWENFSLLLQGTKQDSNVSTVGGSAVAGRGNILGTRAIFTLPSRDGFFHSANFGFDWKKFDQDIEIGTDKITTPIEYWPFTAAYGATWVGKGSVTDVNASVAWAFRGLGSDEIDFDDNRFGATGGFAFLRLDASHEHKLPADAQFVVALSSQLSDQPLINNEQFAGGGMQSVRGYLEAESPGDSGITGQIELRSPSLLAWTGRPGHEWRIYGFFDFGYLGINNRLPEQTNTFELASLGIGTSMRFFDHFNGIVEIANPLTEAEPTESGDTRLLFRVWGEF